MRRGDMWQRLTWTTARATALALAMGASAAAQAGPKDKVSISHRTGNGGHVLINVLAHAAPAHLDHGDVLAGTFYPDADGDGFGSADASPAACPDPGFVSSPGDCEDTDPSIHPSAPDALCDGVDQNCDGTADDGYVASSTACGVGACASQGQLACIADAEVDSCSPGNRTPEICDAIVNPTWDPCAPVQMKISGPSVTDDATIIGSRNTANHTSTCGF